MVGTRTYISAGSRITKRHAESGLIIFKLIEGTLAHSNVRIEVIMDDMVFPSFSSSKARSRHTQFGETGDAVVRELDMSKITFRLSEKTDKKGEGGEDKIIAKLQGQTIDFLQRCLVRAVPKSYHEYY